MCVFVCVRVYLWSRIGCMAMYLLGLATGRVVVGARQQRVQRLICSACQLRLLLVATALFPSSEGSKRVRLCVWACVCIERGFRSACVCVCVRVGGPVNLTPNRRGRSLLERVYLMFARAKLMHLGPERGSDHAERHRKHAGTAAAHRPRCVAVHLGVPV